MRDLVCEDAPEDYVLTWRVYGINGVRMTPRSPKCRLPNCSSWECIAPTRERAAEVVRTTKQYLLHHGYQGRLSTAGNLAFPFTPPEVSIGPLIGLIFTISCERRNWMRCFRWKLKRFRTGKGGVSIGHRPGFALPTRLRPNGRSP